jgi:hypothetical protein
MLLHVVLSARPACSMNVIMTLARTVEIHAFGINTLRTALS